MGIYSAVLLRAIYNLSSFYKVALWCQLVIHDQLRFGIGRLITDAQLAQQLRIPVDESHNHLVVLCVCKVNSAQKKGNE
jgi:hypothetical protein